MKKRRYVFWGAWTALAVPLFMLIAMAVLLAFSYDGKCGGFMPGIAAAKPCTIADYVLGNLTLYTLIVWIEFWPIVIALLALPIGLGYMLDRRTQRKAA